MRVAVVDFDGFHEVHWSQDTSSSASRMADRDDGRRRLLSDKERQNWTPVFVVKLSTTRFRLHRTS